MEALLAGKTPSSCRRWCRSPSQRKGGRFHVGMVAAFKSECRPACDRNPGRFGVGNRGRFQSESAVAFTFGLLHGFGFAGALSEVGLPEEQIPIALLFFNLGVEGGQVLFIAGVLAVVGLARHAPIAWPRWTALVPPYAIGSMAMFWVIQRVAAF